MNRLKLLVPMFAALLIALPVSLLPADPKPSKPPDYPFVAPWVVAKWEEEHSDDPPAKPEPAKHGKGFNLPSKEQLDKLHAEAFKRHGHRVGVRLASIKVFPATWDSIALGWIPPIRNQGPCGDCFGVEASDAATIAFIKGGYQKPDGSFVISEQYGLDCGAYEGGCDGGDGPQVYDVMKSKGFPAEKYLDTSGKNASDYPGYTANPGRCQLKAGAKLWQISDWGYVTSDQSQRAPTVSEVKAGIMSYGTVTFAFDAGALDSYSSGIIKRLGNNIDHEITGFVGWDDSKNAFKCRNQWGASFGENGYFWLDYGALPAIVEACFLTATALPPPPPGPTPPGPTPPGPGPVPTIPTIVSGTILMSDGSTQKLVAISPGMTLQQIFDNMQMKPKP